VEEDTDVIEDQEDANAVAAYYADDHVAGGGGEEMENIQFDERLGLSVEGLPQGMTTDHLWRVI